MDAQSELADLIDTGRVFRLLILYRWLSLIPPALALAGGGLPPALPAAGALGVAAAVNLFITLFPERLNQALRRQPGLLAADIGLCGVLAAATGGWNTPYYLYGFGPLLAAAFFFQWRGALAAAAGMSAAFLLAGLGAMTAGLPLRLVTDLAGFVLIGGAFGYAATLLLGLRASHAELRRTHRDLEIIHRLTHSLQSAADVDEVADRVLEAVTQDLRFGRAALARVDPREQVLTAWRGRSADGRPLFDEGEAAARLPLAGAAGAITQCLLEGQAQWGAHELGLLDQRLRARLGPAPYHLIPMTVREHTVGILLVEAAPAEEPARLQSLRAIAGQASVALGTTMLCIDRAQRLAVQDERLRIAQDIHDTTSQTLFGLHYALDACSRLLPDRPAQVKAELEDLSRLAESARSELRQSILNLWPSELTAERFAADLQRYLKDYCRAGGLALEVSLRGDFARLSAGVRRSLYRIAQEAVVNVARHAAASRADLCLEVRPAEVALAVRDDGRGFDPATALAREHSREHFGLRSIQERAAALGGEAEFLSQPGGGATVLVTLPIDGVARG